MLSEGETTARNKGKTCFFSQIHKLFFYFTGCDRRTKSIDFVINCVCMATNVAHGTIVQWCNSEIVHECNIAILQLYNSNGVYTCASRNSDAEIAGVCDQKCSNLWIKTSEMETSLLAIHFIQIKRQCSGD